MKIKILALASVLALALAGCGSKSEPEVVNVDQPGTTTTTTTTGTPETPATDTALVGEKSELGDKTPLDGEEVAVLETNHGRIVFRFFSDKAPNHVKNFKKLANEKFYDGTRFHRVIPGFMIQGGDPNSKDADPANDGIGGPGYQIDAEFNDVDHVRGVVSMARSADPNSAGSQFFIMVAHTPALNNQYSAFGQVVEGLDVADKIVNLPTEGERPKDSNPAEVKSIKIMKWPISGGAPKANGSSAADTKA